MSLKKVLTLISLLLPITFIYGSQVTGFPKQELVPGGIAIIEIPINTIKATYKNKPLFITKKNNKKYTIIGIPLNLESNIKQNKKLKQKITIHTKDGKSQIKNFFINLKKYPTSKITIKNQQMVKPNNNNLNTIINDQMLLKASYKHYQKYPNNNLNNLILSQPTKGIASSSFGARRIINNIKKNPHKGMDIASPKGTPIYSSQPGKVILAKNLYLPGNTVIIDHGKGFKTLYAHLDKIFVKNNQFIKQNYKIGTVGNTGRVTGPHLHWSVILNGEVINPNLFLK